MKQVFVSQLKSHLGKHIRVVEFDANINDEERAQLAVEELHLQYGQRA